MITTVTTVTTVTTIAALGLDWRYKYSRSRSANPLSNH